MSNNSLEIVHEGWLTKSPPKKAIWKARWRRRWFVLRHSGELPGQYFLEYYTDMNCRKLKGKIDLDQCDQVDAGLKFENHKQKYQYLFDVRTPKRTFYLAAESEKDMNKWVDCVCHVCGLKAFSHEDEYYDFMPPAGVLQGEDPVLSSHQELNVVTDESPNPPIVQVASAPVSLSGPYILISECISGRPLNGNGLVQPKLNGDALSSNASLNSHHSNIPHWSKERTTPHTLPRSCLSCSTCKSRSHVPLNKLADFYDMPRRLHPPSLEGVDQLSAIGTPPLHSPAATAGGTDGESISCTEEEDWAGNGFFRSMTVCNPLPSVNWNTYPKDGEGPPVIEAKESTTAEDVATLKFARRYAKMSIADNGSDRVPRSVAPPRPPKPLRLMEATANKHSYLNLDSISPKYGPEASESAYSNSEPSPGIVPRPNNANSHSPGQPTNTVAISDETYDFPRSHQHGESSRELRHCYSNAAPGRMNDVFCYDFHSEDGKETDEGVVVTEEPTSPRSESSSLASSTVIYSNLPSPLFGPSQVPSDIVDGNHGTSAASPVVNRDLKPGRKASDSASHDLSPGVYPVPQVVPPTVDRTLKPHKKLHDAPSLDPGPIKLASPPACRTYSNNRRWQKQRASPSPIPSPPVSAFSMLRSIRCQSADEGAFSGMVSGEDEMIYYTSNHKNKFSAVNRFHENFDKIQYLDLDHPESTGRQQQVPKSHDRSQVSGIVYRTVDFVKTEAFKRTKQEVEEERKYSTVASHD